MAVVEIAYGSLYFSTPVETTNVTATPIKCAGTTTAMQNRYFTAGTNRLTYTGTRALYFNVLATLSMTASAATEIKIFLYKNGSLITGTEIIRQVATAADEGAGATQGIVQLATDDYVELWCQTDDGDDVTIQGGVITATLVG